MAVGGVVGPVAFVTAWSALGASTPGYSPVDDAISRLAASGASSRIGMSAGFGVFGVGMTLYAGALRSALPGPAWVLAVATGVATLGVAALPLQTSMGDAPHHVAAAIGYATLAALPPVAGRSLARQGRQGPARWSTVTGAVSAACLLASTLGPAHGLFQRAGLTVVDAWVVASAVGMLARPGGTDPRPGEGPWPGRRITGPFKRR